MKITMLLMMALIFVACSCNPIKYADDLGFLNSAHANSMEYLVKVGGSICKDMDNKVGLCAKRIPSNKAIKFDMDARAYSYTFDLKCSSAIDSNFSIDVAKNAPLSFSITPDKFASVHSFTCIGEIFPHDRDQEISAKWQVRAIIFDGTYQEREIIYKTKRKKKEYLVFGKHARYVSYNGKQYKKKTMVKIDDEVGSGYSESERMRFNYYGY